MSPLLKLIKITSALYQCSKLKDKVLHGEIIETYNNLTAEASGLFQEDKKAEASIRQTIQWMELQPENEPIIKSNLIQRVNDFLKDSPELQESIAVGLEDYPSEEKTRQIIYAHLEEIIQAEKSEKFEKKFKTKLKDFYFNDISKLKKEQWGELCELIQEKVNDVYQLDTGREVAATLNTDSAESIVEIVERAKLEKTEAGVLQMGLQGMNKALYPDNGMRRAKFYLINALTNRGKSFGLGHIVASVGLYNKPMLRNKSKIPTLVLDSAEDTLDLIIERIYKLVMVNRHGKEPDFMGVSAAEVADVIIDAFRANGWFLVINQVIPSEDNIIKMTTRIRQLQMKGHEVIFWAYDYLGMADLEGTSGDTKGDRLHDLYRRVRAFIVSQGICFVTPHQLSPDAKRLLRESDDDAELNFAKEAAGKSMTETSTKITNEVDAEFVFHVARTRDDKTYFTGALGKMRGEGAPMSDRFFIYNLDPTKGLEHDFGKKPAFRKSFKHILDENGNNVESWDFTGD